MPSHLYRTSRAAAQQHLIEIRPMPIAAPARPYRDFCASLGCPIRDTAGSWSAINHDLRRALFSVWDDRLAEGRVVIWRRADDGYETRRGGHEKLANLHTAIAERYETYGILCHSKDTAPGARKRAAYDDRTLLVLRLADDPQGIVAYVVATTTAETLRAAAPKPQPHTP